jgi:Ca2+-binding RTX toxin-like protein
MARVLKEHIENWGEYNYIYENTTPLYLTDGQSTYTNWTRTERPDGAFTWKFIDWDYHTEIYGSNVDNVIHGNGDQTWAWYWGVDNVWNGAADKLHGGGGNDILYGNAGDDSLFGDEGHDRLYGGEGNDRLEGGTGDDVLMGGNGTDHLFGGDGGDWLVSGSLSNGASDQLTGGKGADTFVLGEAARETSTSGGMDWGKFAMDFAFSIFGDVNDTAFVAGRFDGTRTGKLAKEIVPGVAVLIEAAIGIFTADKGSTTPPAEAAYATVTDFNPLEDIILIPLNATGPVNIFLSLDQNGENAFTIKSDTDGASGVIATINFADAAAIYGLDATKLSPQAKAAFLKTIMNNALVVGGDGASVGLDNKIKLDIDPEVLASFGSSRFMILGAYAGMTIEGSNADEYQFGTNHADIIAGYALESDGGIAFAPENAGNDELRGFGGDDLLMGGGGNNYIFGGSGSDTVSYVHSPNGVVVDLGAGLTDANGSYGTAQNGFGGFDKLYEVENVIGSAFADDIRGDAGANTLQGLAGNDVYTGGAGADKFILDKGVDRIRDFTAAEGDKLVLSMTEHGVESFADLVYVGPDAAGVATLVSAKTGQTIVTLDNMTGNTFDAWSDVLLPGDHDGFVFGTDGADRFTDAGGDQLYFGLGGSDSVSFAGAAGQVVVDLTALEQDSNGSFVWAQDGRGGADRLYRIEKILGGSGQDYLVGDSQANVLAGGGGEDMLIGGLGADTFIIGGGRDIVRDYNFAEGDRILVDAAAIGIAGMGDLSVRNGNELFATIGEVEVSILVTAGGLRLEDIALGSTADYFG